MLIMVAAAAQEQLPRFEDYRAAEIFKGKPAAPVLRTSDDRMFRTRIRRGAAEGPNFAGYLTIVVWGCGAGCIGAVVVDARNGKIHGMPFGAVAMSFMRYADGSTETDESFKRIEYKLDSRMLLIRGCPEQTNCGSYYYEWTGSAFRLIRKIPAAPK
jgi:hypothetical protein